MPNDRTGQPGAWDPDPEDPLRWGTDALNASHAEAVARGDAPPIVVLALDFSDEPARRMAALLGGPEFVRDGLDAGATGALFATNLPNAEVALAEVAPVRPGLLRHAVGNAEFLMVEMAGGRATHCMCPISRHSSDNATRY